MKKKNIAADTVKNFLVARLRWILEHDLDSALQGDYDQRGDIMSRFEGIVEDIEAYKN